MALQQFESMINQLLSSDNILRGQAESAFNDAKKTPDLLIASLVQLIRQSEHVQIKVLCCVLLRRVTGRSTESLLSTLQPDTLALLKQQLLESVELEAEVGVRNKLADCIAELAGAVLENGQWNELLPFLFKCTKSQNDGHREIALLIFSQLAPELGEKMRPHFAALKEILLAGLNDPNSLKVRIAAMTATSNFLQVLTEHHERQQFQQLTLAMLGCVSAALNAMQEEDARAAIELFVDLAELDPTFLRPHLDQIVTAMQAIATAQQLEDATKQIGVEFLVTLAESKPGMARKHRNYIEVLVPIVLNMMLDLEDSPSWNTGEDDVDIDITNADIGEESLDRLALAMGGKGLVPVLFAVLPGLFNNPDWKHRHTALMTLSIIGEGCRKALSSNLQDIIKTVLPFFRDPHPRVRWAACNTIGQMSTDFGPELQSNFHAEILPMLIAVMDDVENPRVQSHAASAVINFCEHATTNILGPYLETLLAKLMTLLHNGRTIVQEQVVTAVAAIADCTQQDFVKYYDTVVPYLKSILSNANGKEYRNLRGKAMECITLIGVAVGKEKFYHDAKEIMELMLKTQTAKLEADDPQIGFLLQGWARICRCLGKDFVPYLPHVMPPLLHSAKIQPDVTISEADGGEEQEGWEFIPIGDKRIGINTSALEEKSTACNMLFCYASELEEGFFPYVDEVAKLLVPLMRFYYHDGVRSAAISTMPYLLTASVKYMRQQGAAQGADTTYVRNLFNYMYPTMLEALKEEIDMELLVLALESFTECVDAVGDNPLDEMQLKNAVDVINALLTDIRTRRQERKARKSEEDHDEEEDEKIMDEDERDEEITSQIAEFVGHVAKFQKVGFFRFFEQLMPTLLELLRPGQQASDRQAALCVWDDVVDFQKQLAIPYFQHFIPIVLQCIADEDPALRQAAVYGIGSACEVGGQHIAPLVPDILSRLSQVITQPGARKDAFANPTDNAIAAVGKICLNQSTAMDPSVIIPIWLSWLPVTSDKVESKVTYSQLCTLVETSNPHLLGPNYKNIPLILQVFGEVLETELIDEEITRRIVNILKQMQSGLPMDMLQGVYAALSPISQQKLARAIQTH